MKALHFLMHAFFLYWRPHRVYTLHTIFFSIELRESFYYYLFKILIVSIFKNNTKELFLVILRHVDRFLLAVILFSLLTNIFVFFFWSNVLLYININLFRVVRIGMRCNELSFIINITFILYGCSSNN